MQLASKVVVLIAGLLFAAQATEARYRYRLFSTEYGRQPYINHVADDAFLVLHTANAAAFVATAIAAYVLIRTGSLWSKIAICVGLLNLAAWSAFVYMHRSGMLVPYMEFIRHMKDLP